MHGTLVGTERIVKPDDGLLVNVITLSADRPSVSAVGGERLDARPESMVGIW